MPLRSKSEIQFLQGQKKDSKSHKNKARTIFPQAYVICPTLVPDFGLTDSNMLNMSMRGPLGQSQRFRVMICKEQAQRKRPL
jgi:hypothetical protein